VKKRLTGRHLCIKLKAKRFCRKKENSLMKDVREILKKRPLLFDGGMGTYYKAKPGQECEQANLLDPDGILTVHRAYLEGCVGQVYPVLFEQAKDGLYTGHAPNYMEVGVAADGLHNVVKNVKIVGIDGEILRGELT